MSDEDLDEAAARLIRNIDTATRTDGREPTPQDYQDAKEIIADYKAWQRRRRMIAVGVILLLVIAAGVWLIWEAVKAGVVP